MAKPVLNVDKEDQVEAKHELFKRSPINPITAPFYPLFKPLFVAAGKFGATIGTGIGAVLNPNPLTLPKRILKKPFIAKFGSAVGSKFYLTFG